MSNADRMSLIEQQLTVLRNDLRRTQQEVSEVLGEIQSTVVALSNFLQVQAETADIRVSAIEKKIGLTPTPEVTPEANEGTEVPGTGK